MPLPGIYGLYVKQVIDRAQRVRQGQGMYIEKWVLFLLCVGLMWLAGNEEEKRRNLEQTVNQLRRRLRERGISEE